MVDDFGQARLADPGLLCVLTNGLSRLKLEGKMRVPYRWMAPELLLGILKSSANLKATFATDIYSVSIISLVLFFFQLVITLLLINSVQEIFTGSEPFTYDSNTKVVLAVLVETNAQIDPKT